MALFHEALPLPMTGQAPHISYTRCIFSSTDFQCMCKVSIMYRSTNKPTAPKSPSSLHTSKCCFKMHIYLPQNGCNDSTCKHVWEGTKNGALWDNSPISPAQAREHSQHKALKTHLQKNDEFCRDFPVFASLYPAEYLNWQRQYGKYSYTVISNSEPKFEIPLSIDPLLMTTRKKFLLYSLTSSCTAALLLDFLYWK